MTDRAGAFVSLRLCAVVAVCGAVLLVWGAWRMQDASDLYHRSIAAQAEGLAILERLGPPAQAADSQASGVAAQVDVGFTTRLESALDAAGVSTGSLRSVTPRVLQGGRVAHRVVFDPISLIASVRVLESLCGAPAALGAPGSSGTINSGPVVRVDSYALRAPNRPSVDEQGHETWRVEVELLSTETLP